MCNGLDIIYFFSSYSADANRQIYKVERWYFLLLPSSAPGMTVLAELSSLKKSELPQDKASLVSDIPYPEMHAVSKPEEFLKILLPAQPLLLKLFVNF
ncbi:hypothetical protein RJT34_13462 [Clitoria ternatea]|uniref:Uncharacterized protein n=1 Tax=Clitoria ternatea TaxID=43366 RepID=A0AAN9PK79_CLITE